MGLNPCYSGQWSRTTATGEITFAERGLNPCCSGQWSRTEKDAKKVAANFVS